MITVVFGVIFSHMEGVRTLNERCRPRTFIIEKYDKSESFYRLPHLLYSCLRFVSSASRCLSSIAVLTGGRKCNWSRSWYCHFNISGIDSRLLNYIVYATDEKVWNDFAISCTFRVLSCHLDPNADSGLPILAEKLNCVEPALCSRDRLISGYLVDRMSWIQPHLFRLLVSNHRHHQSSLHQSCTRPPSLGEDQSSDHVNYWGQHGNRRSTDGIHSARGNHLIVDIHQTCSCAQKDCCSRNGNFRNDPHWNTRTAAHFDLHREIGFQTVLHCFRP